MIIVPKSCVANWIKEFKKWLPCCNVVNLIPTMEEREPILKEFIEPGKFDVCVTTYEGAWICLS